MNANNEENLDQEDTGFILWCLGFVLGVSEGLDDKHKKFIKDNHDRVALKIGRIHERQQVN